MWSSLFLWVPIFSHSPPIWCPVFLLECQFQRCHQTQRQCPSVDFFSSLHSWIRSYLSNKSLIPYSLLLFCFPSQTLTNTERFSLCLHNMARLTSTDILQVQVYRKRFMSLLSPEILSYWITLGHLVISYQPLWPGWLSLVHMSTLDLITVVQRIQYIDWPIPSHMLLC